MMATANQFGFGPRLGRASYSRAMRIDTRIESKAPGRNIVR